MEVATQDAIERLMRHTDFKHVLNHISGRRDLYLQSLTLTNPDSVALIAQAQGQVKALDEILRLPEDAINEKRTRNG